MITVTVFGFVLAGSAILGALGMGKIGMAGLLAELRRGRGQYRPGEGPMSGSAAPKEEDGKKFVYAFHFYGEELGLTDEEYIKELKGLKITDSEMTEYIYILNVLPLPPKNKEELEKGKKAFTSLWNSIPRNR